QYLVGDWNGDGKDELAVRRGNQVLYQGRLSDTRHAGTAGYGNGAAEDQYLVGDWNGNRRSELAVRRNNLALYQGQLAATAAAGSVTFGNGNSPNADLVVVVESVPANGFILVPARVEKRFDALAVREIVFRGEDGDDSFTNQTAIASTAYGGNGRDDLRGGS